MSNTLQSSRSSVADSRRYASVSGLKRSSVIVCTDLISYALVVVLSFFVALGVRWVLLGTLRYPELYNPERILYMFGPALLILLWRSWRLGHYTQFRPGWTENFDVIKTVYVIAAFDMFLLFAMGVLFSRLWFGFFLLGLCVQIPLGRYLAKRWMIARRLWFTPTYIVGVGHNARTTFQAVRSDASLGYEIRGFIDIANTAPNDISIDDKPILRDIPKARSDDDAPFLLFALDSIDELEEHRSVLNEYIAENAYVSVAPPNMGLPLYGATVVGIFRHDASLLRIENNLNNPWAQLTKRATDVLLGVASLVVLFPAFAILALLIRRDGGPVFYRHRRIGRDCKPFYCLKFRTMVVNAEEVLEEHLQRDPALAHEWQTTHKLRRDPRVTRIGHYLRKTSMDELPQLWNVMRGEMSLVGPRPITQAEVVEYGEYLPYYETMTPGITGLWQVSGRSTTSYAQRVRLDVWYSRNWNLWTDIAIVAQTVRTLIQRHGAY